MFSTDILVAHSNQPISSGRQEPSPRAIVVSLRLSVVHIPLELDHDPFARTIEVHDEAVQHVLSPKL
jgi:hypothetical protein